MAIEVTYLNHANTNEFILKEKGVALTDEQLQAITKMELIIGAITVSSTNQAGDSIRWLQVGYAQGEVRFFLGGEAIPPSSSSTYTAYLIVYDPSHVTGLVWGSFGLSVKKIERT